MAKAKKEAAKDAEDGAAEGEGAAAAPKKKFRLKKIIILVAGARCSSAAAASAATSSSSPPNKHDEKPVAVVKPAAFYDLPEVLVNLSNAGTERTQYLKRQDRARGRRPGDRRRRSSRCCRACWTPSRPTCARCDRPISKAPPGSTGCREELTRRVNVAIAPTRINAVLFKEIIVQ